ncbi:MAG: transcriptional regulator/antitoxin, MazE [Chloroflexi bacterium RBG_13_57_8]|nr:MAG: transcriptional regulator/antitoxin, MazE [Chloroflexi bacterium RBG_13_57_8]
MVTKVQKWGNSQGLRIAKHVLEEANISLGDDVDVSVNNGKIIISPTKRIRRKYDIRELLAHMPEDYKPEEVDWGKPAGKEAW